MTKEKIKKSAINGSQISNSVIDFLIESLSDKNLNQHIESRKRFNVRNILLALNKFSFKT